MNLKVQQFLLGSEVTLTNNEIKDITKLNNSLENKGILLKGNTKKQFPERRTY